MKLGQLLGDQKAAIYRDLADKKRERKTLAAKRKRRKELDALGFKAIKGAP